MDVYKTKSVYKAPGVYRSGIYKDPSEVVLLNGVRYENRFYEIDSNNVGSTFVDAVRLPEGYEKLNRVWYNGTYDNSYPSLVYTDFQIPIEFGTVYLGAYPQSLAVSYARIFTNHYIAENTRYVRAIMANSISTCLLNINTEGPNAIRVSRSASYALRDDNKYQKSLVSDDTWYDGSIQSGIYTEDRTLELLSSRGLIYFRFLFFANSNKQVTFTAIPCKHGSDYGLYDVVAGKFYTHADFTGD